MNYTCCGQTFTSPQAYGAHKRRAHPNGAPTPSSSNVHAPFSATLFSVISGEVHLRGCEFQGGFLVLNGDSLRQYSSLADAISEIEIDLKHAKREAEEAAIQ